MSINKTRNIPLSEFLEVLQLEYVVAQLRSKIYFKPKDKTFWGERVLEGKRKKINDILERNPGTPSIFDSPKEADRIKSLIFREWGMPNFYYRDEEQRLELEIKDFFNYFSKGASVKVRSDKDIRTGVIISTDENRQFVTVKIRGEEKKSQIHITNLSRII